MSGKIHNAGFEEVILPHCGAYRSEVVSGPAFGVDVAVTALPGGLGLAMTSDPLSLIPSLGLQESAWLSVHLMANDMATTGFAPQYAQMVLNLPPSLTRADFARYWQYIHGYCKDIGVAITGGHTGAIEGQHSTIAGGGTMLLTAPLNEIRLSRYARPGELVVMTKECALSSAALLAMSFPETVRNRLGKELHEQGCALFTRTSSLLDGLVAIQGAEVTAMHDVTEGGVLGAVYEMAFAAGCGVRIVQEQLPGSQVQQEICNCFGIDYRYCIGAGSMIMSVKRQEVHSLLERLQRNQLEACVIGEFTAIDQGYTLVVQDKDTAMPYYPKDPYWAAFFGALQKGWK